MKIYDAGFIYGYAASHAMQDQIILHLFQPHQADQMLTSLRKGVHLCETRINVLSNANQIVLPHKIRSYYISSSHTRLIRCLTLTGLSQARTDE